MPVFVVLRRVSISFDQDKKTDRMEKKFVRQNSTSYRHSLPGIVENGVYNEQEAADRRSAIVVELSQQSFSLT